MNLYTTFNGTVKYQQVKKLESNYLSIILLQAVNGRGKKSNYEYLKQYGYNSKDRSKMQHWSIIKIKEKLMEDEKI